MSLYGAYLARVPPGRPRDQDWVARSIRLNGAVFFFGDYDLHHLVRIHDDSLPLCVPEEILQLAPEQQLVLLCPLPGDEDDLILRWPARAREFSLVAYVEIRLQPHLVDNASALASVLLERFLLDGALGEGIHAERYLGLSGPDLVFYLFGNDLHALDRAVGVIRSRTYRDLAAWLDVLPAAPEPEPVSTARARITVALKATEEPFRHNHVCQSVYLLYGLVPNPGADGQSDSILDRIPNTPTQIRPTIFISTFPGHERNESLRRTLRERSGEGTTFSTAGLFDLVHHVLPPDSKGSTSQREVLRRTIDLLTELWRDFGPTCISKEGPTIFRTTTVLCIDNGLPETTIPPHGIPPQAQQVPLEELSGVSAQTGDVLRGLLTAFNGLAANHLTSSHVAELRPFLLRLITELRGVQARLLNEPSANAHHGALAEAFDDLFHRIEATLVSRSHGTIRSLRADVSARPSASLQQLLTMYARVSRAVVEQLAPLLDPVPQPAILYTVGGTRPASSYSYFGDPAVGPGLVITETASLWILQPDLAIFPLIHELMHVLPAHRLKEVLADGLLNEAARRIARLAVEKGCGAVETERDLSDRIERAFLHDCQDDAWRRGQRSRLQAARGLIRWSGILGPYLDSLLRRTPDGAEILPGPAVPDRGGLDFDALRACVGEEMELLLQLAKETVTDVMAAFATSPMPYLEVMRRISPGESERLRLLERAIGAAQWGEIPSGDEHGALVSGLAAIGVQVAATRRSSSFPPEFFERLSGCLSSRDRTGAMMLLSIFRGAT